MGVGYGVFVDDVARVNLHQQLVLVIRPLLFEVGLLVCALGFGLLHAFAFNVFVFFAFVQALFFGGLRYHGFHHGLLRDKLAQLGAVLHLPLAAGNHGLHAAVQLGAVNFGAVYGNHRLGKQAA